MAIQEMSCDQNLTNRTVSSELYDLADTYKVVAGLLIFLGTLPFVLLNVAVFPIGSLVGVLLGALLMVMFQVVTQDEVYDIIGSQESLTAVLLIIGILVIAQYFEREQLLVRILRRLLVPSLRFENYLVRVCLVTFLLSIFFTSDLCCMVLPPVVLKLWESQERPRAELETIVLAVMTTANIGAMVTVFSSLQMALMAAWTGGAAMENSRLDMRSCLMYLLPVATILGMVNTSFLVLHYRMRTRCVEKTKLVNEPSSSEQEMAGLTARDNGRPVNTINISSHGFINGYLGGGRDDITSFDGAYLGTGASQRSDDRISIPCQLETIPENDILEITSLQSSSLRDCRLSESPSPRHQDYQNPSPRNHDYQSPSPGQREYSRPSPQYTIHNHDYLACGEAVALECTGSDGSSSSDSDGESDRRMRNTDENLHQLNLHYRPGALQSQNLAGESCTSLVQSLEQNGLRLSKRLGIYRSLHAFSVAHFLPATSCGDDVAISVLPSDSTMFLVTLCVLVTSVLSLLLASCYSLTFDLGLIPLAAAILAVIADAILNRRVALVLVKRADWSIIILLFGLFVWVHGFNNTHVVHVAWERLGLRAESYGAMGARTLAVLCVCVLLGSNLIGTIPVVLMTLDLLEPCAYQRGMVLYLAVLATAGGNISLYGSTANMFVVQRSIQVLKYRLSFLAHLHYGLISSLILLPLGILLIYGLLLIGVR